MTTRSRRRRRGALRLAHRRAEWHLRLTVLVRYPYGTVTVLFPVPLARRALREPRLLDGVRLAADRYAASQGFLA